MEKFDDENLHKMAELIIEKIGMPGHDLIITKVCMNLLKDNSSDLREIISLGEKLLNKIEESYKLEDEVITVLNRLYSNYTTFLATSPDELLPTEYYNELFEEDFKVILANALDVLKIIFK